LPDGKVIAVGGAYLDAHGVYQPLGYVEVYDPVGQTWTVVNGLTNARFLHTTTLLPNGQVLVAGGYDTHHVLSSAALFDSASTCPNITIVPSSLPAGSPNVPYAQTLDQVGAVKVTWRISGGSLPPGLTLDPTTGKISGTPTTVGTFGIRVMATAGNCNATRDYTITIGVLRRLPPEPPVLSGP